jgi:hypothetical protein
MATKQKAPKSKASAAEADDQSATEADDPSAVAAAKAEAEAEAPHLDALKTSASDKEAPVGKDDGPGGDESIILDKPVSQSDQSAGVKEISSEDLESEHDFNATTRGAAVPTRDNSEMAGNSEPRTWEQVYRENATDIDIRAGVEPDQPDKENE